MESGSAREQDLYGSSRSHTVIITWVCSVGFESLQNLRCCSTKHTRITLTICNTQLFSSEWDLFYMGSLAKVCRIDLVQKGRGSYNRGLSALWDPPSNVTVCANMPPSPVIRGLRQYVAFRPMGWDCKVFRWETNTSCYHWRCARSIHLQGLLQSLISFFRWRSEWQVLPRISCGEGNVPMGLSLWHFHSTAQWIWCRCKHLSKTRHLVGSTIQKISIKFSRASYNAWRSVRIRTGTGSTQVATTYLWFRDGIEVPSAHVCPQTMIETLSRSTGGAFSSCNFFNITWSLFKLRVHLSCYAIWWSGVRCTRKW